MKKARPEPRLELLEARDLPSAATPDYLLFRPVGETATPFSSTGPTGYTPAQVRHAYGFDQVSFSGTAGDGSGTTIAIVDAYDDPTIASDLAAFDTRFGLAAPPSFTKVNQSGGTAMPAADSGWAGEIALDVEWAHAIAPRANLLLVEASDSSYTNLFSAVDYAARQPGVVAVSTSWGGGESPSETSWDSNFVTPSGHTGVVFVASSGDYGAPASYPAISPNVLAVGGTSLPNLDAAGDYTSESGWSGSGGGVSAYEAQPSYQKGVVTQSSTYRANPDVAYDADPNTGFPIYDSYGNGTAAPWEQIGGTSDAAPQWAALVAIADQGRALAGKAALDGPTLLSDIYQLPASDFHDVTSGGSTGSQAESAGPGYDLVTGRGSPLANRVITDLVGSAATPSATHFRVSVSPSSTTAGTAVSVTLTALDANNSAVSNYLGTVHFTSSDTAAVLPANYTFTTADAGSHTFSVTLKKAGSQSLTATDTANSGMTGTVSGITVNPAAATHLAFGQQPTNAATGSAISPAVTVQLLDPYNNVVTTDSTDTVTLALASNPGGATLSGGGPVAAVRGVATFNNLAISKAGTGYALAASSGTLAGATSASFTVAIPATTANTVENFENGLGQYWLVGSAYPTFATATYAAHDGTYGLDAGGNGDWIYRNDAAAQVQRGDTISVWAQLSYAAGGRAYFGFGASSAGTLSLVLAPNTNQFMIQNNVGYGFSTLGATGQTYLPNHWYRMEVAWGTSGTIIGRLYDSDGKTLLNTVTAASSAITSGGIAFRATGDDKYFDTVTVTHGVNNFAAAPTAGSPAGSSTAALAAASAPETRTQTAPASPSAAGTPAPAAPAHAAAVDRFFVLARAAAEDLWWAHARRASDRGGDGWLTL